MTILPAGTGKTRTFPRGASDWSAKTWMGVYLNPVLQKWLTNGCMTVNLRYLVMLWIGLSIPISNLPCSKHIKPAAVAGYN